MTNPRVVVNGNIDVEATKELRNREPLSNEEIDAMLLNAEDIENDYFRLRVKALIAIAKKFGKRRAEIAALEREDLKVENGKLYVTFTLVKKHKRGLFQYLKFLRKNNPVALNKPLTELELDWKEWTKTSYGYRVKEEKRTKSVDVTDKYAQLILEYIKFLEREYPDAKYVFPSGIEVFGSSYVVFENEHLSGRQLLNLVKPLNPKAWLHLFRETKGAEIAKAKGRTLDAVYSVRDTLDLENEETAYRYVRRYAVQEMKAER
jgi:integrase